MKHTILTILGSLLMVFTSCETFEEEEVICLPVNVTTTLVQGTDTKKLIADFHYIPGTGRLDHITRSNHQTHYFEYDADGRIMVVRMKKVDTKIQDEMWFHYDGPLVDEVILVKRNLDYIYLEPLDSVYAGVVEFDYNGRDIIGETRSEVTPDGQREEVVWLVEYAYDINGNITSSKAFDPRSSSGKSVTMTYDGHKHPFSGLHYYFTGESFVNNLLSRSVESEGIRYNYELELNEYGYPDMVYEKLGTTYSRIIRYSYMSK